MIRLLLKTHSVTGLKYLCKTTKDDYSSYNGSGVYWRKHLREFGTDHTTLLLFETEDREEFKRYATEISRWLDVVQSNEFANKMLETGTGGSTVSGRRRITDGRVEKYISSLEQLPCGWKFGRSDTNPWKNSKKQTSLSNRQDRTSESYKQTRKRVGLMVSTTRDHSRCGRKGDAHPCKRPDIRDKISKAMSRPLEVDGIQYTSLQSAIKLRRQSAATIRKNPTYRALND